MNNLLTLYRAAVLLPDASGFEHLQMFDIRDELEAIKFRLTQEECRMLAEADQQLLAHAHTFYVEIARIADLAQERLRHTPPPTHWWWYLDVLVQVPNLSANGALRPVVTAV